MICLPRRHLLSPPISPPLQGQCSLKNTHFSCVIGNTSSSLFHFSFWLVLVSHCRPPYFYRRPLQVFSRSPSSRSPSVPSFLLGVPPVTPPPLCGGASLPGYTLSAAGRMLAQSSNMFICGFQASDSFTCNYLILKTALRSKRAGIIPTWYSEKQPGGWCDTARAAGEISGPQGKTTQRESHALARV